jgi:hypothetical protein
MSSTVSELRRAWAALGAGQFAEGHGQHGHVTTWTPAEGERLLPVVGAHGTAGASTLALAIATVAAPARVVECAPTSRSGLVGAATAELGGRDGWQRGTRDEVVLERWNDEATGRAPTPAVGKINTTVVDIGSHLPDPSTEPWLTSALDGMIPVVIVGDLSLHGIRRIQQTLSVIGSRACVVAIRGPKPHRSPRYVRQALGELEPSVPLIHVPDDPRLRLRGVDTSPLPSPLLAAAEGVLIVVEQAWRKEIS